MSAAHTPTPWSAASDSATGRATRVRASHKGGRDEVCVADCAQGAGEFAVLEANARFIVHAVNCHDELLSALTLARTFMVDFEGLPETEADNPLRVVDAALAKTREIGK